MGAQRLILGFVSFAGQKIECLRLWFNRLNARIDHGAERQSLFQDTLSLDQARNFGTGKPVRLFGHAALMNPARGRTGFYVQFHGPCSVLKTEPESRWSKNFYESAAYERQNSEICSEVFSDHTYLIVELHTDTLKACSKI